MPPPAHVVCMKELNVFCFILLTHEGSHTKVDQEFQPSYDIFRSAKGCSDHRFRALPAYTAQFLTLHQHNRANNQYRTANQI